MAGCSAVAPAGSSCEGQGETVQKTKAGEHGKTHCKPETAAAAVEDDDPRIPASGTSHHDEGENGGASCASPSDDETYALASRKALKRLLPVLLPLVVVNYMDRAALSLTASALMHKLGMSETTLGVAMGVFYGPYCALQLPSLWLAKHVSVRWWLATITVAWGCTTFGTAFVTARWQLIVARLLLGAAEAGTFPLLYYYLDQFLSPLDMAQTWSCGVVTSMQIATVIAAPVATLVLSTLEGALGCEGWQWVYLILGGLGVFVGILILLLLLDPPTKTSIFSSEQQRAIARLKTSFTGLEHGAAPDLLGGLRDCRGLYLGLFAMLYNSCVIVFSAFTPTIIANLLKPIGVAPEEAYIYSVALTSFPYLLALVEINASAYAFRHTPSRCYWGYGISLLAVVIILFSILPLAYNSGVFPVAFLTFSFLQAGVTAFVGVKDILPGLYLQKNGASASYFAVYNSMRNLSSIWIPSLAGMMMPVWGDAEAVMVIGLAHAIPSMFLFTGWFYLIGQDQPFPLAWPRKEVKDTATKSPCEAPSKYDCATPTVV